MATTPGQFNQAAALAELESLIAGRSNEPAEEVFKDIQVLRRIPAGRLLKIMDIGFSRSLGVTCTHCHVIGRWESSDKTEKQVARQMWDMTRTINAGLLTKISGLKSAEPTINCTTCHRGQVKPALDLP